MTFGERIKRSRESHGWNVRDLEREARLSWMVISRVESGERKSVSMSALKRLAKALGVTTDYLIGMYDDEEEEEQPRSVLQEFVQTMHP